MSVCRISSPQHGRHYLGRPPLPKRPPQIVSVANFRTVSPSFCRSSTTTPAFSPMAETIGPTSRACRVQYGVPSIRQQLEHPAASVAFRDALKQRGELWRDRQQPVAVCLSRLPRECAAWADARSGRPRSTPVRRPTAAQRFSEPQAGSPQAAQVELPRSGGRVLDDLAARPQSSARIPQA